MAAAKPYLSALIPVYNEEENLPKLGEEVSSALDAIGKPYEVILVDDGSKDGSYAEILKLVAKYPNFKTVRFARNAGQTAAMLAGIQHASGDVIVCLDADMQNDARDVPKLLEKMNEGYDVVSGWRKDRQDRWLDRLERMKLFQHEQAEGLRKQVPLLRSKLKRLEGMP